MPTLTVETGANFGVIGGVIILSLSVILFANILAALVGLIGDH